MAASYGDDISRPAENAREAVQWLYYAYLGAVKEQDGAAMSLGRVDAFLVSCWWWRVGGTGLLASCSHSEFG